MRLFKKNTSFKLSAVYNGHHKVTYKAVPAIKCPFDYTIYQMIIWEVQPDLVIEIGSNKGGSTLYIADLLELNKKGEIHTIDINTLNIDSLVISYPRIKTFSNEYLNYNLSALDKCKPILVIEDGSHTYKDTLKVLQIFNPLVTIGSYFNIDNYCCDFFW